MKAFTKAFLEDKLDSSIEDTIVDTSRWSEHHEMVFEHEGQFFIAEYSCGKTEYQDERPWGDYRDEDEIECWEAEKIMVAAWVRKSGTPEGGEE